MSYRRVGLALLMAAALGASVFIPKALADSNARIVRLSYVDGAVQMDNRDGRGFEHAFLNMPLVPGTRVTTRDDGRAEIEFEDMSTLRLAPDTLVETQTLDLRSTGAKSTIVDLEEGTAYFNVRKLSDDDDFRVTAGQREFSLTKASRFRVRVDRSQVVLAVFKGEVEVTGQGGRLTVRKNETLTLDLDDPSRYYLAKGVSEDRYDEWDRDRDEYRDQYARASSYRDYSPAYSYGVSDLNYWGGYTYIAGYGYMWRPYYYGVDWNPFNAGAWYWYPGYGWVWVSAYPWGWMPFRYGNWYYIHGHGWCWHPGHRWNTWSPVVVVHNAPPGHVVPVAPPPTGRRDPVLVGQGPQTILPPQDQGPQVLRRRDGSVVVNRGGAGGAGGSGPGPGAIATPGSGPGSVPSGRPGSSLTPGSGSGAPTVSGGTGQPAVEPSRRPTALDGDANLEEKIRDARDRRTGGGSSGAVTGSGSGSSALGPGSAGAQPVSSGSPGSGPGASSPGNSSGPDPFAGRARLPESRRPVSTPDSAPSSGGTMPSSGSRGSSATPPPPSPAPAPAPSRDRSPEPPRETPHNNFVQGSGSGGSTSGYSSRSASAPSGGGSSGSSYRGSSAASSSGSRSSGGVSSGGSHSSGSSGRSSSSGSSKSSSPK